MDSVHRPKRTLPTPSEAFVVKRAKSERCDNKLDACSPPPIPLGAPHGVERICLPASLAVKHLSSQRLEQLASERTEILRAQGRRVVGLPLVLDDGIVLNWQLARSPTLHPLIAPNRFRYKSASAHKADGVPLVRQTTTSTGCMNEEPRLLVPPSRGSGTSAADAIIIDSDEDISPVSPLSRTAMLGTPPLNGTSLNRDVVQHSDSDSDTDSLPSPHIKNKGKINQEPSRKLPPPEDLDLPPNRALTGKESATTPFGLHSDDTDMTTSDSEVGGTGEAESGTEDIHDCKIPSIQPHLPLQLSRDTFVGSKRQDNPDIQPEGTIVARKELPKKAPANSSSETEEGSDFQVSNSWLKRVPLPKTVHGRARRLLMPDSTDLPLVAVTMRGDCHFIERKKKYRISRHSLPNPGVFRHVTDVCMVGNTAVLGCDKGTDQISFLSVAGKPQMINVACSPHSSGPRYQDTQRRGVSCLAAIHAKNGHIKFLSGGYDGVVHKWMAGVKRLDEPRFEKVVSYGACIMALAYRDRDRSMLASVQKGLHVTDLNRQQTSVYPFSNDIQQIHIHPQLAHVTLLEVRHLDDQIQLYDNRERNFSRKPCSSFGYRSTNGKFPATHTRGSVHLLHFAKASEDGCVLLWDFRYSKRTVVEKRFQQAENVVHTIFAESDIATFGQGVVTFFEDYLVG